MTKKEKEAKEKFYQDAIIWIYNNPSSRITKEEMLAWTDENHYNDAFPGKYQSLNGVKQAMLERIEKMRTSIIEKADF